VKVFVARANADNVSGLFYGRIGSNLAYLLVVAAPVGLYALTFSVRSNVASVASAGTAASANAAVARRRCFIVFLISRVLGCQSQFLVDSGQFSAVNSERYDAG